MNIMIIVGIIVLFLFLIIIGGVAVFFIAKRRKGKKFEFLLYSNDGANVSVRQAVVKSDPSNDNRKRFFFIDSDQSLPGRALQKRGYPGLWRSGIFDAARYEKRAAIHNL